jgi:hypothetical protein
MKVSVNSAKEDFLMKEIALDLLREPVSEPVVIQDPQTNVPALPKFEKEEEKKEEPSAKGL